MLKNAPTLAIVAVHTAENEPPKVYESNMCIQSTAATCNLQSSSFNIVTRYHDLYNDSM